MARCRNEHHPQLPKTYAHVFCVYCHQCQAFQTLVSLGTQWADDVLEHDRLRTLNYGPFDSPIVVLEDAQDALEALIVSSGRPWDHQLPADVGGIVVAEMRFHDHPRDDE